MAANTRTVVEAAGTGAQLDRIVECVNANTGIANPAKVGRLIAKVRSMIERGHIESYPSRLLKDLLADLDKAPDAEGGG